MLKGREQLADHLVKMIESEAIKLTLTEYDSGKSVVEVEAEGILGTLHAQTFDVAAEYDGVKQKLRGAILDYLDVLGA
jgi:hypothetical protein